MCLRNAIVFKKLERRTHVDGYELEIPGSNARASYSKNKLLEFYYTITVYTVPVAAGHTQHTVYMYCEREPVKACIHRTN